MSMNLDQWAANALAHLTGTEQPDTDPLTTKHLADSYENQAPDVRHERDTVPEPIPESTNDELPPTCGHCGAGLVYVELTGRWVTTREGFRVASCKASPTMEHQPMAENGAISPGNQPAPSLAITQAREAEAQMAAKLAEARANIPQDTVPEAVAEVAQGKGNWPASPALSAGDEPAPSSTPVDEPAEPGRDQVDLSDYQDRWNLLTEARADKARAEAQEKEARDELLAVLAASGLDLEAVGTEVDILVEGKAVGTLSVSQSERLDVTKWQARNAGWKGGRYCKRVISATIRVIR